MGFLQAITPLFRRVIAFLAVFVLISGLLGPRIINSDILFRDGFAMYGSIGKALIFGLIALVLLLRPKMTVIELRPWRPVLLTWFGLSLLAGAIAWLSVDRLLADQRQLIYLTGAHGGIILSVLCAAMGCLGAASLRALWRGNRRELMLSAGLTIGFYLFLFIVYALWQPLASVVLWCVRHLLGLSGLVTVTLPPHTLILDKFGITVAEYCSGVESIALFTGLYAVVGLLDWQQLRRKRYFLIFPFALLVLCLLNVLRVYGLIMAGYHINPVIAFSLFHTYAGLVFFILYSVIFWMLAYKHLLKSPQKEGSYE